MTSAMIKAQFLLFCKIVISSHSRYLCTFQTLFINIHCEVAIGNWMWSCYVLRESSVPLSVCHSFEKLKDTQTL